MCSSAMAVEYGHFFRSDSSDGNAWNKSIILEEGDQFIFLGSDNIDPYNGTYQDGSHCTVEFTCVYQGISITRSLTSFSEFRRTYGSANGHSYGYGFDRSELSRTITGPCEISPSINDDDSIVEMITRKHIVCIVFNRILLKLNEK